MIFRILFTATIALTAMELVRPRFVIAHLNLEWFLLATIIASLIALGAEKNPGLASFPERVFLTLAVFLGTMVVGREIFSDLGRTGVVVSIAVAFVLGLIAWMEIRTNQHPS